MDWKWIDRAYQFDEEPSGGGMGDDLPQADDNVEILTEPTSADDVKADDAGEGAPPPDVKPEPGPEPKPEPPAAVTMPEDFDKLFQPPEQPPARPPSQPSAGDGYPPATPRQAPPKVDFPTGDEFLSDPEAAAAKQAAAVKWLMWESTQPLHQTIEQIQRGFEGMQRGSYEERVNAVNHSADETKNFIKGLYAENGVLNSDKEFRNNPEVQKNVNLIIRESLRRALWIADNNGETGPLDNIRLDGKFVHRALALAKADATTPSKTIIPGASPVGPQPPTPATASKLSKAEQEAVAAAKRDGRGYSEKEIAAAKKIRSESIY